LSVIRASATATVLVDGQVLIAGGFGNRSIPWASAEVYDPHGTSLVAARTSRPAPTPIAGALLFGIPALLLGLSAWLRRDRIVPETWID